MRRAQRLVAASVALVLTLFPFALERCRAVCVSASSHVATSAAPSHACHHAADADPGPTAAPVPVACGHSDDARVAEARSLAPTKVRVVVIGMASAESSAIIHATASRTPRLLLPFQRSAAVPLNLPLRL
ncbi:MAG TPA: hypothetical protein VEL51_06585 [Vicinamibacterales bacterium]|nr:hypothetical protein [Vicinamibacterales bacterium]